MKNKFLGILAGVALIVVIIAAIISIAAATDTPAETDQPVISGMVSSVNWYSGPGGVFATRIFFQNGDSYKMLGNYRFEVGELYTLTLTPSDDIAADWILVDSKAIN